MKPQKSKEGCSRAATVSGSAKKSSRKRSRQRCPRRLERHNGSFAVAGRETNLHHLVGLVTTVLSQFDITDLPYMSCVCREFVRSDLSLSWWLAMRI